MDEKEEKERRNPTGPFELIKQSLGDVDQLMEIETLTPDMCQNEPMEETAIKPTEQAISPVPPKLVPVKKISSHGEALLNLLCDIKGKSTEKIRNTPAAEGTVQGKEKIRTTSGGRRRETPEYTTFLTKVLGKASKFTGSSPKQLATNRQPTHQPTVKLAAPTPPTVKESKTPVKAFPTPPSKTPSALQPLLKTAGSKPAAPTKNQAKLRYEEDIQSVHDSMKSSTTGSGGTIVETVEREPAEGGTIPAMAAAVMRISSKQLLKKASGSPINERKNIANPNVTNIIPKPTKAPTVNSGFPSKLFPADKKP